MIITTDAVVLNGRKYGDTSKIISLFTEEQGKVPLIAKGARGKKNKFGSALDPLSCITATYYFKPGRELQTITAADIIFPVRRIQDSIIHLAYGLAALETVSQAMPPLEENHYVYELLINIISYLNEKPGNPFSAYVKCQIELARLLGFKISTFPSKSCGSKKKMFSIENGAAVDSFSDSNNNIVYLNENILDNFHILSNVTFNESAEICFEKSDETIIINFFKKYFGFHLERKFSWKSLNLINLF